MANLTGAERSRYVQEMFTRIADRYDVMNRLMTAGQDVRWRQEVVRRADLSPTGRLLDLGAGTGDLSREVLRQHPGCRLVAADFTLEMMRIGRSHMAPGEPAALIEWVSADGLRLPFPNQAFDAVVSGFLLRNVTDVRLCLAEQYRVLKPGGRIVTLDTSPPPHSPLAPLIRFHLHTIIPTLGRMITGQAEAYNYLPNSTENFLEPEILAARLAGAGFSQVGFQRLMFGTIAIHWGVKDG
ncbi:MAG TPA: ubiquinone/menaquinone biosynthesis methyltransferase [Anaerolineales bacterium]